MSLADFIWGAAFLGFAYALLDHILHSGMLDDHGTAADRNDTESP